METAGKGDTFEKLGQAAQLQPGSAYTGTALKFRSDAANQQPTALAIPDYGVVLLLEPGTEVVFNDAVQLTNEENAVTISVLLARLTLQKGSLQVVTSEPPNRSARFEILTSQGLVEASGSLNASVSVKAATATAIATTAAGTAGTTTTLAVLSGEAVLWQNAEKTVYLATLAANQMVVMTDATVQAAGGSKLAEFFTAQTSATSPAANGQADTSLVKTLDPATASSLAASAATSATALSTAVAAASGAVVTPATSTSSKTPDSTVSTTSTATASGSSAAAAAAALPGNVNTAEAVSAAFQPSSGE